MVSNKSNFHGINSIGQVFTPDYVAEFMVKNITLLITRSERNLQKLKILEPSAGEGVFLKYLIQNRFSNIIAFEMDLSLRETLLKSYPEVHFKFNNFLSSNTSDKYDVIIGNPPYLGQNYNSEVFQEYVKNYPICAKYFVGNMDLFYYFIHLGIEKLNPGGFLSFITTNYWITKSQKTGIKFLKPHILNECFLIQYIDLSNLKIFEKAKGQHNCIFVLQKKNNLEQVEKLNKNIRIVQILTNNRIKNKPDSFNELIFKDLMNNATSSYIRRYTCALTNSDLKYDRSWNLLYPNEIKSVIDKIENYCKVNGKISRLNDYFIIRNGLILINDNIFILKEGKQLKVENDQYFIYINGEYAKLNEFEINRLKKVYKSKSIIPYGFMDKDYIGYILYFNKNEFKSEDINQRNHFFEEKYPSLTKYLKQFKDQLRETLINAKENPNDIYFPRRGSFIRHFNKESRDYLIDLESFYDMGQKIFFKFISKDNIFGYTNKTYYATSDTYFLWPKSNGEQINLPFILAYMNSRLVSFLFKAKNITIKRSKTKLEYSLPVPNINRFVTEAKATIINLIKNLTSILIEEISPNLYKNIYQDFERIIDFKSCYSEELFAFSQKLMQTLKKKDKISIQRLNDLLFFHLFDLDEKQITKLLNEYYNQALN